MDRIAYFGKISQVASPLSSFTEDIPLLLSATASNDTVFLKRFAEKLKELGGVANSTRAAFIRLQCDGINTEDMFLEYCETWGIPRFEDAILTSDDFRNGFLWTFRDHTSSWPESDDARDWFYSHPEALFVRKYEYWSCDRDVQKLLLEESGDYKTLLWAMIEKHADYSPFASPAFTRDELFRFYEDYNEEEYNFGRQQLLAIFKQNPNWDL